MGTIEWRKFAPMATLLLLAQIPPQSYVRNTVQIVVKKQSLIAQNAILLSEEITTWRWCYRLTNTHLHHFATTVEARFHGHNEKIDAAVELAEITANLSNDEVKQFRSDLEELTKNSPKAQVSAYRFKETMKKVGSATASGVRDIVVDVLSETAKKIIWG